MNEDTRAKIEAIVLKETHDYTIKDVVLLTSIINTTLFDGADDLRNAVMGLIGAFAHLKSGVDNELSVDEFEDVLADIRTGIRKVKVEYCIYMAEQVKEKE